MLLCVRFVGVRWRRVDELRSRSKSNDSRSVLELSSRDGSVGHRNRRELVTALERAASEHDVQRRRFRAVSVESMDGYFIQRGGFTEQLRELDIGDGGKHGRRRIQRRHELELDRSITAAILQQYRDVGVRVRAPNRRAE